MVASSRTFFTALPLHKQKSKNEGGLKTKLQVVGESSHKLTSIVHLVLPSVQRLSVHVAVIMLFGEGDPLIAQLCGIQCILQTNLPHCRSTARTNWTGLANS